MIENTISIDGTELSDEALVNVGAETKVQKNNCLTQDEFSTMHECVSQRHLLPLHLVCL